MLLGRTGHFDEAQRELEASPARRSRVCGRPPASGRPVAGQERRRRLPFHTIAKRFESTPNPAAHISAWGRRWSAAGDVDGALPHLQKSRCRPRRCDSRASHCAASPAWTRKIGSGCRAVCKYKRFTSCSLGHPWPTPARRHVIAESGEALSASLGRPGPPAGDTPNPPSRIKQVHYYQLLIILHRTQRTKRNPGRVPRSVRRISQRFMSRSPSRCIH